jgi:phosphotransferase family enzyme
MSDVPFARLTAESACAALAVAGLALEPAELRIEQREDRWLVRLPGERLAWFAASATGRASLATERRVLRLLEARCAFAAPRVLYEAASGDFELRSKVPGGADAWQVYRAVEVRPDVAKRLGAAIGAILAEQHSRIAAADVAAWLPHRPSWPEPRDWVRERLATVIVGDAELRARADAVLSAYESVAVAAVDRALVHADVGFHNLAIDAESYAVAGVFDYEGAAWADRHHDFRYLVLDYLRYDLLDAARAAYEPAAQRTIDRERVVLYNAACAVTFLAFRAGHAAEERWCGRTLEEDLRWSKRAIDRVLEGRTAA